MLKVENLRIKFSVRSLEAVNGISFTLNEGEILGLVGESGSGKSVTAQSIMGLLDKASCTVSGNIEFNGRSITGMSDDELMKLRGMEIAMVFQDPFAAMDPLMKVGWQVEETLRLHTSLSKAELKRAAIDALGLAELSDPEGIYEKYPYELSGGMLQRAMIASAIAAKPKLLILDEPTTALDVTVQAQILELIRKLNRSQGITMLFISHNLGVVRRLCSRTVVMEKGLIVEEGETESVFTNPQHEYTKRLIAAIPKGAGRRKHDK